MLRLFRSQGTHGAAHRRTAAHERWCEKGIAGTAASGAATRLAI
jgi:hypothetical protein